MKLHLADTSGLNLIRAYQPGRLVVNEAIYTRSVAVTAVRVVSDWRPATFSELSATDFEALVALEPELVLLGTGSQLRFPDPRLAVSLTRAGIGLEVMDTGAACRTFNILVAESRAVLAALLMAD